MLATRTLALAAALSVCAVLVAVVDVGCASGDPKPFVWSPPPVTPTPALIPAAEDAGEEDDAETDASADAPTDALADAKEAGPVDPKVACEDMANEVAQTGKRECNFPVADGYQEFLDQFAGGSCANVKTLRDPKSLYEVCIPFLKAQNCAEWTAGTSDPSCDGQLILQ